MEGLAPGEKVAAAGAFLIDAESRLNPGAAPDRPNHVADDPERVIRETNTNVTPASPAASNGAGYRP